MFEKTKRRRRETEPKVFNRTEIRPQLPLPRPPPLQNDTAKGRVPDLTFHEIQEETAAASLFPELKKAF